MTDVLSNATTNAVLEMNISETVGTYSGHLEAPGDHDWIKVTLTANTAYQFFLSFQEAGSRTGDSDFTLRDAAGNIVAHNGDATNNDQNSFGVFTPPTTGTYYIDVSETGDNDTGAYSVLMTTLNGTNVFLTDASDNPTVNVGERVAGGAGSDFITFNAGGFDALGEQGDDILFGNTNQNLLSGGLGNDFLSGDAAGDFLFGDAGDDSLIGGADGDQLFGGDGFDKLDGGADADRLSGGGDDDVLIGGAGVDVLNGGLGTDFLTGGTEADNFDFNSIKDSVKGLDRDQILDFSHAEGDRIDLATIDANTHKGGNQAFHFIGAHKFGHHDGELRYKGNVLSGDVNGDGRADFEIHIDVASLLKGDFIL
jgi:Ca2+-binding RTX toxin-like protein